MIELTDIAIPITSDGTEYSDDIPRTNPLTRIFKSTLTRTVLGAVALYKGCIQPLSAGRTHPATLAISWIALGILYQTKEENWLKRLIYEVTICGVFGWDRVNSSFQWTDLILPATETTGALALSSQPLKNKKHHVTYHDWAVLSMNERSELYWTSPLSDPVTPEDWQAVSPHREHKILECYDYYRVPTEIIIKAVKWIHMKRKQGIDVLVHCKAGKGRSGTIVICYLLFLKFLDGQLKQPYQPQIQKVIKEVKEKRSFVASGKQAQTAAAGYLKQIVIGKNNTSPSS